MLLACAFVNFYKSVIYVMYATKGGIIPICSLSGHLASLHH